jgi:hypothetical protein
MPQFNISSGLPSYPSGLPDSEAGLVLPIYQAVNSLARQLSQQTGNVQYSGQEQGGLDQFTMLTAQRNQKMFVKATETLGFGKLVTLTLDAGKIVASLADATDGTKPAHAVVDTVGGIATGSFGEAILLTGKTSGISGTGFMTIYYLSTAGQVQSAAPTASGALVQVVGYGLGSAGFYLQIYPGTVV